MAQSVNKSPYRGCLLVLLHSSPLSAMWITWIYTYSVLLSFGVLFVLTMVVGVVVGPSLKRRWEIADRREAASDSRQFVLVLRPFKSPLVERRPGLFWYNILDGTIVAGFCAELTSRTDFAVVCIGDGEHVTDEKIPAEFVRVEPEQARWVEAFAILAASSTAIIVIPDATDGCLRELNGIRRVPDILHRTLVWMPYERRRWRGVVRKQWEAAQHKLRQYGFNLPLYDARGLLYRPNPDFSICEVRMFTGRIEVAAVDEIRRIAIHGYGRLDQALEALREKGIRDRMMELR